MEKALTMDLPISDDQAWAERSSYWLNSRVEKIERRRSRQPVREPLVLTGHGMRLRVENGALLVQNGFTHYPQAVDERRYFPGDRRLPSRIIVVDGACPLMCWTGLRLKTCR
jgi:hypothetical protein